MPALINLFERSIFKNLPGNISKLRGRHPRNPSERPLKHKEKHSKFDNISKNVNGLNLTAFTPPTLSNPEGILTFSRHAVGKVGNLTHTPGHNKFGFDNIDKRHYEGIGDQPPIITHGGSFFVTGEYNPLSTLHNKSRSVHLSLRGKDNIANADITVSGVPTTVPIFQKKDINTIGQNRFGSYLSSLIPAASPLTFQEEIEFNFLGQHIAIPSKRGAREHALRKNGNPHASKGFDRIDKLHYVGSSDQLPIETQGGKFSLKVNYNPLDIYHSPLDSLHLNLIGARNVQIGKIPNIDRKFCIFQDSLNIINPLTHEVLIANSGLFKLKKYDPFIRQSNSELLHSIDGGFTRRPEIEKRYFEKQGFNLPDSTLLKKDAPANSPEQPGGLITLPLPTLQTAKTLINIGDPTKGSFNFVSGKYSINQIEGQRKGDIYNNTQTHGVSSNRNGFLSQPFFETKLQGNPIDNRGSNIQKFLFGGFNVGPVSIPALSTLPIFGAVLGSTFERSVRDAERIGKFLITSNGIKFSTKQFFLQALNSTLETKIWNPASLFSTDTGAGNLYIDRHAGTDLVGSLINAIPGLSNPFPGVRTYQEALVKTGGINQSRIAFQVPHVDTGFGSEKDPKSGIDFANQGLDILTNKFKDHNPNKYKWPVGSDGAGLSFSNRVGPLSDLDRNKKLIGQGEKFTKSIGFNSRENTPKSILDSALGAIPGVAAISNIIAGIRGAVGTNKVGIRFKNVHNLSRPYTSGNEIRTDSNLIFRNAEIKDVPSKGNLEQFAAIAEITSDNLTGTPLVNILDKIATIGETKRGGDTTKPAYTFLKQGEIKDRLGIDGRFTPKRESDPTTEKSTAIERPVNLDSYLQTYGEIGKKHQSLKSGAIPDLTKRQPFEATGRSISYEAFKQRSKESTMFVNLGFAGKQSQYPQAKEKTGLDRINKLDVGETPEDISPFLQELIPFRFFHINENRWIVFRAYLSGITENNSANWNEKRYIGRADPVYTYIGATRKLNFNFDVHPESVRELAPLWRKINAVVALCWPTYININRGGDGNPLGQYMVGPFVRLTIGDMYNQVPGIVNSVTIVADDEGTWETRRKDVDGFSVAQLPKYIRITVDFTIIGKELFDSKANFFDFESGFANKNQIDITNSGREILDFNNQSNAVNEVATAENNQPRTGNREFEIARGEANRIQRNARRATTSRRTTLDRFNFGGIL